MNRKIIDAISIILIILVMIPIFLYRLHIIKIPDVVMFFLIFLLIVAFAVLILLRRMMLKAGGEEAVQIKKEIEEKQKKRTKNQWLTFTIMCLMGLFSASFLIIQLNASFIQQNIEQNKLFHNQSLFTFNTYDQNILVQKILITDMGLSLVIIGGFWFAYIYTEKRKKPTSDVPFDAFEETKKNKKIPGILLLAGLIITVFSFAFL